MRRKERNFQDEQAQPFFYQGGEHGVLLLHGFTGSAAHMRPIGQELNRQGFTVSAIDLPGHGTKLEDMEKVSWQDWLQAAKKAFLDLEDKCRWVSVAGLSMGGVLALLLAQQMPVNAVVTISAPMAIKSRLASLAGVVAPFMPVTYWRESPQLESKLDQRYNYGYHGFPTSSTVDLMNLIRLARENLFNVVCPVLVVQSRADDTIRKDSADIILNGIKSEKKAVLWLDEAPHVCTLSKDSIKIADAMGEFLLTAR